MKPTRTLLAVVATATAGMIAIPVLAQSAEDDPAEAGTTEQPSDTDNEPAAGEVAVGQDEPAPDDARPPVRHEWSVRAHPGDAPMMGDLAADLAEQLGIDEQEVADALDAVMQSRMEEVQQDIRASLQERLDELVADGNLTSERADAIGQLLEEGVELPGLLGGHVVERHDQGEVHGHFERRSGGVPAAPDGWPRLGESEDPADGGPSLDESGQVPAGTVPSGAMPSRSVVDL